MVEVRGEVAQDNGDGSMRALSFYLSMILWASPTVAVANEASTDISFTLTKQHIVSISADKHKTREEFDRAYGQFQVLIPKRLFPIAAPNCRKNVILRMPGTGPQAPNAKAMLDAKWELFQSIHAVLDGKAPGVKVFVDSGPYMTRDKRGDRALEWCNAFIRIPN